MKLARVTTESGGVLYEGRCEWELTWVPIADGYSSLGENRTTPPSTALTGGHSRLGTALSPSLVARAPPIVAVASAGGMAG